MIQWQNSENVNINSVDTSALIEDADSTLNYYADKYIITKYPISTGNIVEYAGIKYIITSQIDRNIENRNKKQYNYRARMRQMDYSIKIVLDGKVEEFNVIIEGQRFSIVEGQYLVSSADKIIVTLSENDISNEIVKGMRFIKLNSAWKIAGIDKTKKGLIILYCDVDLMDSNVDNLEEEIANIDLIEDDPEEPEPEEPDESEINYYIIIEGADKMDMTKDETYTAKVYDLEDERVSKLVTFSVDNTSLATIKSQSNNQCELVANMNYNIGYVKLRATLTENEDIFGEKVIGINQI